MIYQDRLLQKIGFGSVGIEDISGFSRKEGDRGKGGGPRDQTLC